MAKDANCLHVDNEDYNQTARIKKTRLYNIDLLKPHFLYSKNWGLLGCTLFYLFLLKNIDCGYSLEPPRWGGSNEYLQSMFWAELWKISEFLSENFQFLAVEFSIYLNRDIFVIYAQVVVSLRWTHMSEITFSHVSTQIIQT